jgi:multidrug efflux pump subunit AcrA (membrane-fusion protein)
MSAEDTPVVVTGQSKTPDTRVDIGLPGALRARPQKQLQVWPFVVMAAVAVIAIGGIVGERYLAERSAITQAQWVPAVAEGPKPEPVHAIGAIAAKREQTLSFKVPGALHVMAVSEGSVVKAGQLLATIDSPESARANRLIAPFDGVVTHRYVGTTELVGSGTPVVALASPSDGWVVHIALAEGDASRTRMGDSAVVHFGEFGDTPFTGTVTSMRKSAEAFDIEIEMVPNKASLLNGMVARVDIAAR